MPQIKSDNKMTPCMTAPARFETERLLLRKPRMDDAEPVFHAYTSDPMVAKYTIWTAHESVEKTEGFLKFCIQEWEDGSGAAYVIEQKSNPGIPIGMINLHSFPNRFEFGYVLSRAHWKKGYMSEALNILVDWALDQEDIFRISSFCDVDNIGSARVMEKAGLTLEGIHRRFKIHPNLSDEPRDCKIYAKVR